MTLAVMGAASSVPSQQAPSSAPSAVPVIERFYPEAVDSLYSKRIPEIVRNYPLAQIPQASEMQGWYWSRGVRTPEDSDYIGVAKRIILNAPVERVFRQIEDVKSYPQFFDDTEEVEIVGREPQKIRVRFRKKSPTVLVPDIRYTMLYSFDRSRQDRWLIRYQLVEGNSATHTDGLIVLEPLEGGRTVLTAWDFFRANWGVIKAFAEKRIWRETLSGHYRGDLAFRLKAESPSLKPAEVTAGVAKVLEQQPLPEPRFLEKLEY